MVGHALSERVKRQKSRRVENATMQKAVDEYQHEQAKPDGMRKLGYRPIADKYGVSRSTLHAMVNGHVSMSAFNASKRKLTHGEEHGFSRSEPWRTRQGKKRWTKLREKSQEQARRPGRRNWRRDGKWFVLLMRRPLSIGRHSVRC